MPDIFDQPKKTVGVFTDVASLIAEGAWVCSDWRSGPGGEVTSGNKGSEGWHFSLTQKMRRWTRTDKDGPIYYEAGKSCFSASFNGCDLVPKTCLDPMDQSVSEGLQAFCEAANSKQPQWNNPKLVLFAKYLAEHHTIDRDANQLLYKQLAGEDFGEVFLVVLGTPQPSVAVLQELLAKTNAALNDLLSMWIYKYGSGVDVVDNALQAIKAIRKARPDLPIDASLDNALQAIKAIRKARPDLPIDASLDELTR